MVAAITSILASASAQQKICSGQSPTIVAKGDFNSGVASTSTLYTYKSENLTNYPARYTVLDSVTLSVPDTVWDQLVGDYNSVGYGFDMTKIAGRTDSFTIKIYGSKLPSPTTSQYTLLTTLTFGNASAYKEYDINSGNGNPYTKYMFIFSTTNADLLSEASWRCWALVR